MFGASNLRERDSLWDGRATSQPRATSRASHDIAGLVRSLLQCSRDVCLFVCLRVFTLLNGCVIRKCQ